MVDIVGNKTKTIHISELKQGDTVIYNGEAETVSISNVRKGITGWTYKGDPFYQSGGMVEIVLYRKWFQGKITGWHSQV